MTRLTPRDTHDLVARVHRLDRTLLDACGLDLLALAARAAGRAPAHVNERLAGARVAAVPMTAGQGVIPGFSQGVAGVLRHLTCTAWVTDAVDVSGVDEAVNAGATVVFLADDSRFIALNIVEGRCVNNDTCTADGYVAALAAAAGDLRNRSVLLLGLGPIGRAAARRLLEHGARVWVAEPDPERLRAGLDDYPALRPATIQDGLGRCKLILDATPARGLVGAADVDHDTIAAVPGLPSGFTAEAQAKLGARHIHDPLAVGVAVMAVRSLVR